MSGEASAPPAPVRLPDLAEPRFAPEVREQMRAAVAASGPVPFDADGLMEAARERAGLDDFGEPGFRRRLALLLEAIEAEAPPSAFGRLALSALFAQLLESRLRLEDLVARHPEIERVEIRGPIVIAGLQRTGTTHLHNLLSADPELQHLPYWESLEPFPRPGEPATRDARDPRWVRTEQALALQREAMPYFDRMHEMTVDHAHEEIQLLAMDFSTMLFEALLPLARWRDDYLAHDQTRHYAYLKRALQALSWIRGRRERWVLKSPQHIEQLGPLRAVFPDATVVLTHRDPVPVVASVATMVAYGARMHRDRMDLRALGAYWADRTERMLRVCVRERELWPASASLDVSFRELVADESAVVRRVYDLAGQPLAEPSRRAIESYVAAHPRGRHGRVVYDLAEFGLAAGELRERFAFYLEHFGLEREELPAERPG